MSSSLTLTLSQLSAPFSLLGAVLPAYMSNKYTALHVCLGYLTVDLYVSNYVYVQLRVCIYMCYPTLHMCVYLCIYTNILCIRDKTYNMYLSLVY